MIRICGAIRESIVDGPGLRFVVFTQGCPHHCPGCHNPQSHDPQGGYLADATLLLEEICKNPLLKGITLSGGEPTLQAAALVPLARGVRALGKDIWLYSGFTFEELLARSRVEPDLEQLLGLCDVLVDGPYLQAQRNLALTFRGSENQRLISLPQSLSQGKPVLVQL